MKERRHRIFQVDEDRLTVDGVVVLEGLGLTDKRTLAYEFAEAAELEKELRHGGYAKPGGWTQEEQKMYVLNIIQRVCESSPNGYCTRTALIRRACRKYRGINARMLDYYLEKLVDDEAISFEDVQSGNLLEKRMKRLYYYLGTGMDLLESGTVRPASGPVRPVSKKEQDYLDLLEATRKKYESSPTDENSQDD